MVLLDGSLNILLFNSAMEDVLGWNRDEVVHHSWVETCVPADSKRSTRRWLRRALTSTPEPHRSVVVTRGGRRLSFQMETVLIGRPRGLLITVPSVCPAEASDDNLVARDFDYEVTATFNTFGHMRRVMTPGKVVFEDGGKLGRCFEALYQRNSPCHDCPILHRAGDPWPRTAVRRLEEGYEVVTAEPGPADAVRLRVRLVADGVLAAIQEARIDAIADKGRLSDREKEVLHELLLGRSLDEIAASLELSRRTVKFHQGNLLQKLGVDSRVDLIRITGF